MTNQTTRNRKREARLEIKLYREERDELNRVAQLCGYRNASDLVRTLIAVKIKDHTK